MSSISLLELNLRVKEWVKNSLSIPLWVHAEINEIHENASGICYLELVEKGADEFIVAKQKAIIWASNYRMLKPYFESVTQISLQEGIKISVLCRVEFHELYGMSLVITDIDPAYTLGDVALRKQIIIERLMADGVWDMNKELPLPKVPQRIAIISSATAAGYGDFLHQLKNNKYGYGFSVQLFSAIMQGNQVETSVVAAFDEIYESIDQYDVVVLIRGGGATSDLASFDSYKLASHLAQFPLPVICGIGHQRDNTILDMIANTRVNTPTAAADFLIERIHLFELGMDDLLQQIINIGSEKINLERLSLLNAISTLSVSAKYNLLNQRVAFDDIYAKLQLMLKMKIKNEETFLAQTRKILDANSPENVLKKGYALILKDDNYIANSTDLRSDDSIKIVFNDGIKKALIE
ncbi:MAG: exodeoxyribonuclease VII large subunit [Paludibacteraceae bacterium]|nr:exodeoxyribonuclease VII large subunit [Paludibacteraceae bacterium]